MLVKRGTRQYVVLVKLFLRRMYEWRRQRYWHASMSTDREVTMIADRTDFKDKLAALVNKCQALLDEAFKDRPLFKKTKLVYVAEDSVSFSRKEEEVTDFDLSLMVLADRIESTDEFTEFRDIILGDEEISKSINSMVACGGALRRYTDENLVMTTLQVLLETSPKQRQEQINSIRERISGFYGDEKIENRGQVVLENVSLGRASVEIEEGIVLRNLSMEDMMGLLNSHPVLGGRYGFDSRSPLLGPASIIDFSFEEERVSVPDSETDSFHLRQREDPPVIQSVLRLLDAMRIVSDTAISVSPLYIYYHYSPFDEHVDSRIVPDSPRNRQPQTILPDTDLPKLREMFTLLTKRVLSRPERIATNRLAKFGGRDTLEDRILDLFVGFEAMVLGGICALSDGKGELKFRLALLTAKYVADCEQEQLRVYKLMKKGYDVRSQIIHGEEIDQQTGKALMEQLTSIYKRLLYKFINEKSGDQTTGLEALLFG